MGWGAWIDDDWGSLSYDASTQGFDANAKEDTLYYGVDTGAGISALATDRSQYLDNQATGATWHFEASPATRFNVANSWCIDVDVDTDNNDTGFLFGYSAGANQLALSVSGAGAAQARLAGVVIATLALPGVGAGAAQFVISWAAEPNPYTTGAGDAMRSVLRAFNVATGAYSQTAFTHAVRATATGNQVWWASTTGGGLPFTGVPNACRFSTTRFHTSTETREDFIARTSAPTIDGEMTVEFPIVDAACDIAEPGQFAGPVYAMGAASVQSMALRLFSPAVNVQPIDHATFDNTLSAIPSQWRTTIGTHTLVGQLLFCRMVPATATHASVRVRVSQTAVAGADTLSVRVYSMNRPPGAAFEVDHERSFDARYVVATRAANGEGWLDLGELELVINSEGETWIGVALLVTAVSTTDAFSIDAVSVEPIVM